MDILEILDILPHRYPMLLVDKVEITEPGKRAIGVKNVTINEPFFEGHYPGLPLMPGVLIIESMAQVGAVLLLSVPANTGRVPILGAIESVKFRRPVTPGDQLVTDVELLWMRGSIGRCRLIGKVGDDIVCECELTFALRDSERVPKKQ